MDITGEKKAMVSIFLTIDRLVKICGILGLNI